MNKRITTLLGLVMAVLTATAQSSGETLVSKQIIKQKIIDDGGTGMLKAVAVKEK